MRDWTEIEPAEAAVLTVQQLERVRRGQRGRGEKPVPREPQHHDARLRSTGGQGVPGEGGEPPRGEPPVLA